MNDDWKIETAWNVSQAIMNQVSSMDLERSEARIRIENLKDTIARRALEDATNEVETARRVLAHKSSEASALEPGWDVVN